jgi:hypothetical protein
METLPKDICFYVFKSLDIISATRLACISKRWYRISTQFNIFKHFTRTRFRIDLEFHEIRIRHEPHEKSWKEFYARLDDGCCGWRGIAMDPVSNGFRPYEMELVFHSSSSTQVTGLLAEAIAEEGAYITGIDKLRESEVSGICRWRIFDDSVTRVTGSMIDKVDVIPMRFQIDPLRNRNFIRHVVFEETSIIRGTDIAVPNRYYGYLDGFVMIGMFDPGHYTLQGVFCLVMEDSIKIPTPVIQFYPSQEFSGLIVLAGNPRFAHYCFLAIFKVSDRVQGTFVFSTRPCASTCRPTSTNDWQKVSFCGSVGKSGLQDVEFGSHSSGLIPKNVKSVTQIGQVLIGMFDQPHTGCFYLISANI